LYGGPLIGGGGSKQFGSYSRISIRGLTKNSLRVCLMIDSHR